MLEKHSVTYLHFQPKELSLLYSKGRVYKQIGNPFFYLGQPIIQEAHDESPVVSSIQFWTHVAAFFTCCSGDQKHISPRSTPNNNVLLQFELRASKKTHWIPNIEHLKVCPYLEIGCL